jgi:hypothetical protein
VVFETARTVRIEILSNPASRPRVNDPSSLMRLRSPSHKARLWQVIINLRHTPLALSSGNLTQRRRDAKLRKEISYNSLRDSPA